MAIHRRSSGGPPAARAPDDALARRGGALDRLDVAMILTDLDGVIVDWTHGAARLFGWSRHEALGARWDDLAGPIASDPDPRRAEIRDHREAGKAYRGELTIQAKSGERIPVIVDGSPLFDESGTQTGSVTVAIDDRRRTTAEERFETIFRGNPVASVVTVPPRQLILDVNPAFERLSGYTREAAIGRTATELGLWKTLATRHDVIERIEHGGPIPDLDTQMVTAGGRVLDVRLSGQPIAASDGPAYVWMAIDESDRVQAERALRASAARLAAVVDASPMAIVLLDRDLQVQVFNPAAETLFGWSSAEVLGRPSPLETADDGGTPAIFQYVLDGATVHEDEISLLDRSRQERRLSVDAAPVRDDAGTITGVLAMLADVSEREMLQAQLRDAQRMESIGYLAGGIAHDFNNIMTAVGGYASMAKETVGADHPAASDLDEVIQATARAKALTDQLLTFSRRQVTQPRVVDLAAEVLASQPALRQQLDRSIDLQLDAPTGSAWVRADPGQIKQVLANLAANAADAMPDGGSLRVAVEADPPGSGAAVRLTVSDTGHGMEHEVLSHAFEPFYTTKAPGEGTGLGLAVIHGIVRASGGRHTVRSHPGGGATFTITLPLVERVAPALPEPRSAPAPDEIERATVLVAEDEVALRALARRVLELAGHQVVEARDGQEALEIAATLPRIDLLLTDLTMPRMDGVTLARRLAVQRPGLRILYMSGHGEAHLGTKGVLDPSVRLLAKPFSVDELTEAVARVLEEPERP